jgi:hypothetical protein
VLQNKIKECVGQNTQNFSKKIAQTEPFNEKKHKNMKNSITKIAISAWALFLSSGVIFAQKPERINFAKAGSNALVWEQKVKANGTKDFVFYAKKGQKLLLNLIDDTRQGTMDLGKATIVEPGGEGSYETTIEVTKDYIFSVSNNSDKATSFRISISLEDPKKATPAKKATSQTATNSKETVRFAKGATSTTLTRTIAASGSIDFIINAKKGQKMDFTVGYDFNDSDVEAFLTEPGLQDISLTTGPKKPNEFVLKNTGNHYLTVNNTTAKKITITLYLDIQ